MEATPRQNPLEGRLVEGQKAASYFNAQGKFSGIFSGRKTTRLEITDLSGERFQLAAKAANTQQEKLADGTIVKQRGSSYVVISIKEGATTKKVLLNINSAAKRLHLKPNQLKALAAGKEGGLAQVVAKGKELAKSYAEFDTIIARYEQPRALFATAKGRESGHDSNISMRTLRKILAVVLTTPLENDHQLMRIGGTTITAARDARKQLDVSVKQNRVLGAGSFSKITQLFSLTTAKGGHALRTQHRFLPDEAPPPLDSSVHILKVIHKNGLVPGVQPTPRKVYAVVRDPTSGKEIEKTVVATITPAADGSLRSGFTKPDLDLATEEQPPAPLEGLTHQEREDGFQNLLKALSAVHDKGVVHGDIKPDNILYKKDPKTGAVTFEIIDFDDARFLMPTDGTTPQRKPTLDIREMAPSEPIRNLSTPKYLSQKDMQAMSKAVRKGDQEAYNDIQKKRDVFAMGITCYQLVTGGHKPGFIRDKESQVVQTFNRNFYVNMLAGADVDPTVAEIILDMLNPDPSKRPQAATCLKRLEAAMATDPKRQKTTETT